MKWEYMTVEHKLDLDELNKLGLQRMGTDSRGFAGAFCAALFLQAANVCVK